MDRALKAELEQSALELLAPHAEPLTRRLSVFENLESIVTLSLPPLPPPAQPEAPQPQAPQPTPAWGDPQSRRLNALRDRSVLEALARLRDRQPPRIFRSR